MSKMPDTDASNPDRTLADAVSGLSDKMDQMLKVMNAQLHLQRVALLEPGNILRFNAPDMQKIIMALPDAQDDYVQGVILQSRGFYEAKLLAKVQELGLVDGRSIVCDVGANIGNHSIYFAALMGAAKVHAFEPQVHCHATLCQNIALNGLGARVEVHHTLVGTETGRGQMQSFNTRNLGGTSFAEDPAGDVELVALDDVISPQDIAALDLIKIDVEGMQLAVLQGAAGILQGRKPALWVEVLKRDNAFEETAAFLAVFGYKHEQLARNDFLFQV